MDLDRGRAAELPRRRFSAYTTAQGLPADTVWFSHEDRRHRLWAITSAGPACFNGKSFVPVAGAQSAAPSIARAGGGRARNALAGGQQRRLRPRYHARHPAPGLAPAQRRRRWKRSNSTARANVWIGTSEGLERYAGGTLAPVYAPPGQDRGDRSLPRCGGRHVGRHGHRHGPRGQGRRRFRCT